MSTFTADRPLFNVTVSERRSTSQTPAQSPAPPRRLQRRRTFILPRFPRESSPPGADAEATQDSYPKTRRRSSLLGLSNVKWSGKLPSHSYQKMKEPEDQEDRQGQRGNASPKHSDDLSMHHASSPRPVSRKGSKTSHRRRSTLSDIVEGVRHSLSKVTSRSSRKDSAQSPSPAPTCSAEQGGNAGPPRFAHHRIASMDGANGAASHHIGVLPPSDAASQRGIDIPHAVFAEQGPASSLRDRVLDDDVLEETTTTTDDEASEVGLELRRVAACERGPGDADLGMEGVEGQGREACCAGRGRRRARSEAVGGRGP